MSRGSLTLPEPTPRMPPNPPFCSCAFVHMMRDEFAEAGRRYNESLQLCQSSGDDWGLAWSRYALAFTLAKSK